MSERWDGGAVGERAVCVREDNPGVMTLEGTNTWVLREPGGERSIVVDPGEGDEAHMRAVLEVAAPVALVLLTHRHDDHRGLAAALAADQGCPVRATDPAECVDGPPLVDGEVIEVDGLEVVVVATPGHTSDSTSFLVPGDGAVLTGDTVLGRGTTVVAHPDGVLGPYLDSLERLLGKARSGLVSLLPGHGPVVEDPVAVLEHYLAHRAERLEQVRAAVAGGATTPRAVVEQVYADVDESVWPAAELSVAAQLDHLAAGG
ncbi:MBL fold metallo-hydrolase [Solicola sp. PLA-1-18]|uniref:MBL fold metallo-hydrolase n=1 Tax=Solicola sp. PLA-1-18 TaxID=3380532 RepID=UPI003B7AEE66